MRLLSTIKCALGQARGAQPEQTSAAKIGAYSLGQDLVEFPQKQASRATPQICSNLTLPRLLFPKKQQSSSLKLLIGQINAPGWHISNGERIDENLTLLMAQEPSRLDTYLWRGILRRIMGRDARSDLRIILEHIPDHRQALLNMALLPITCRRIRMEDRSAQKYMDIVDSFLLNNPDDYFAQIIKGALHYLVHASFNAAIRELEAIYVRYPGRAPTTALMAAIFQSRLYLPAAAECARETLS